LPTGLQRLISMPKTVSYDRLCPIVLFYAICPNITSTLTCKEESQYHIEGYKQISKVPDLFIWNEENSYYSALFPLELV
jgi:hypothetical protein